MIVSTRLLLLLLASLCGTAHATKTKTVEMDNIDEKRHLRSKSAPSDSAPRETRRMDKNLLSLHRGLTATTGMYFPDWEGNDKGCLLFTGDNAPVYMVHSDLFMKSTLQECCSQWYDWAPTECEYYGGATMAPTGASSGYLWIPDYGGKNNACLNSGFSVIPSYMEEQPRLFIHANVESCCAEHYNWNDEVYAYCMDNSGSDSSSGGNRCDSKWYFESNISSGERCVKSCDTNNDPLCGGCRGRNDDYYDNVIDCCNENANSDSNGCKNRSETIKWHGKNGECVQDCRGSSYPCGGYASADAARNDLIWNNKRQCCRNSGEIESASLCLASGLPFE